MSALTVRGVGGRFPSENGSRYTGDVASTLSHVALHCVTKLSIRLRDFVVLQQFFLGLGGPRTPGILIVTFHRSLALSIFTKLLELIPRTFLKYFPVLTCDNGNREK